MAKKARLGAQMAKAKPAACSNAILATFNLGIDAPEEIMLLPAKRNACTASVFETIVQNFPAEVQTSNLITKKGASRIHTVQTRKPKGSTTDKSA